MLKQIMSAALLCMAAVFPLHADELGDASQALCEKVKSCAVAQMEGEELTPQAREMMQPMLDSMCAQVRGKVRDVPAGHPLYAPAVACMQSMSALTCEGMQDAGEMATPACETFEELAQESGEG